MRARRRGCRAIKEVAGSVAYPVCCPPQALARSLSSLVSSPLTVVATIQPKDPGLGTFTPMAAWRGGDLEHGWPAAAATLSPPKNNWQSSTNLPVRMPNAAPRPPVLLLVQGEDG